jgi:hypothetical protein
MPVSSNAYRPASEQFLNLRAASGHPGPGVDNGVPFDRMPIAAYTIPADGSYSIENSFLTRGNTAGDGVGVLLHVGSTVTQIGSIAPNSTGDFDTSLGFLTAGTTIYIGVSPDGPGSGSSAGADYFTWDFQITQQTGSLNGQVVVNSDQTITYTPDTGFVGTETINYQVSDGRGGSDMASVTVTVDAALNFLLGDVNLDGAVNFLDIAPFIAVLQSGGYQDEADVDQNGAVDFLDIGAFINLLLGL